MHAAPAASTGSEPSIETAATGYMEQSRHAATSVMRLPLRNELSSDGFGIMAAASARAATLEPERVRGPVLAERRRAS
jgi:hypothetical protein